MARIAAVPRSARPRRGSAAPERSRFALLELIELDRERRVVVVLHPRLAEETVLVGAECRRKFTRATIIFGEAQHASGRAVAIDFEVEVGGAGLDGTAARHIFLTAEHRVRQ